jgi:hypothetical protein
MNFILYSYSVILIPNLTRIAKEVIGIVHCYLIQRDGRCDRHRGLWGLVRFSGQTTDEKVTPPQNMIFYDYFFNGMRFIRNCGTG